MEARAKSPVGQAGVGKLPAALAWAEWLRQAARTARAARPPQVALSPRAARPRRAAPQPPLARSPRAAPSPPAAWRLPRAALAPQAARLRGAAPRRPARSPRAARLRGAAPQRQLARSPPRGWLDRNGSLPHRRSTPNSRHRDTGQVYQHLNRDRLPLRWQPWKLRCLLQPWRHKRRTNSSAG